MNRKGSSRSRLSAVALAATIFLVSIVALTVNSTPASAAVTHVQAASREVNSGSSSSVPFTSANRAGDTIVVFVIWSNTGSAGVTDSRGNLYVAATARTTWGSGWSAQTFFSSNVSAGANTVTATFATPIAGWGVVYAHEYSGLQQVSPVDVTSSRTGTTASMTSGAVTTTYANDLIFGAGASDATVNQAGSGFTTRSTAFGNRIEDRTVSTTGSYAATARQNGRLWVMQMVAFKAVAATGDTAPPTQPTGLTAVAVSGSQINLSWTASSDNVGVTGYRVFRNGSPIATPTTTNYSDNGLTAGTTYSYSVTAVDAAGNQSAPSATVSATTTPTPDTSPPTQPTGLTATTVSGSRIDLAWAASADNVAVTGYRVFRDGAQIAAPTTTNYSDIGLTAGTTYSYSVTALDAAGNQSAASATVSATTPPTPDTSPPVITITAPATNATLTDVITIVADATDDVGVASVQFFIDAAPAGTEDTSSPFAYNWDTRSSTNGAHMLTARARDAAGNTTTSTAVPVNVANTSAFQNEILATGFNLPTSLAFLPDGRMLVSELPGAIKVLSPPYTQVSPTPFLQLTNVGNDGYAGLQQGIFSVLLDPNFATNHYYYIFYTMRTPNRDRLSRFTANATLTGTDLGTELVLYQDPLDANTEHHGGAIMFGNDGKLYFTTGEHFTAADAQDLSSPRGKVHRISPDGSIPTDNPFYDGPGPNVDSIWAFGLRNPYRAYYDAPTGRMFIGDVGGNDPATAKEEVNLGQAGANYGWPNNEGACPGACNPLYWYAHNGRDASITGGFVYHGTQFPSSYQGSYFFADYAQNWIKRLTLNSSGQVTGVFNFEPPDGSPDGPYGDIVFLAEGPDGALYYIDLGYSDVSGTFGTSKIRRIRYLSNNLAPTSVAAASPTGGAAPLTVTFSSSDSVDPEGQPLTFAWDFGDGTSSTEANPSHIYLQPGPYTARLTVSDGVSSTISNPLEISVGNLPTATILSPTDASTFVAGDVIAFSGTASDAVDGALPASAYTWTVDFLHDGHVHPGAAMTGITSGTFTIPTSGHDFSGDTRYRITLSVVNSAGLRSSASVTIYPVKVNLTFVTSPPGLTLYLDGIARTTPFTYDTVPGFVHTIDARDQSVGSTTYRFSSWSDGGAALHSLVVPPSPTTYTATYTSTVVTTPPAFVQVNAATPQTNQSVVTVSYLSTQLAGDTNVIAIGWNDSTGSVLSVQDTAGNIYQLAAPVSRGVGLSQTIYYASNIKNSAAGANTVTVTFSSSLAYADVRVLEYSGIDKTNPVDVTASASGATASASSGSVTTTFAKELIFGAGMTFGGFTNAANGATTRIITVPDGDIAQDQVVGSGGSYSASATLSYPASWLMQVVAFRAG